MREFLHLLFNILDDVDKKRFKKYILVLFIGSVFSVTGVGAVIPFITLLIQPNKILSLSLFQGWQYNHLIILSTCSLIFAFAIKNVIAVFLLLYQSSFLFALVAKIQNKLFANYMALPYEYHLNRSTPDLIKNINNETTVLSNYVIAPFGTVLTEFFSSMCVLAVLLSLNFIFTSIVTIFLVLGIALFMGYVKNKTEYYGEIRTIKWSAMTQHVLAGLSGIKEVKLYHREKNYLYLFSKDAEQLKHSSTFQLTFQQLPRMLIEFIGLTVVMCALCVFILLGSNPKELFILLSVFGVAAAQLLPSLNRLTQGLVQIKYGIPALKTIYKELKQVNDQQLNALFTKSEIAKRSFEKEIIISDMHHRFSDETVALNGVNIKIPKGKKVAFIGESGAGKTTLVDLLMGLHTSTIGSISIDGDVLKSKKEIFAFQQLFGYIPQTIILHDATIKENIAFAVPTDEINTERVWGCLKLAHMDGFVKTLKNKDNTYIGEGGIRLSGGQRQRIGIARALYRQPEILVMDEATSALDNRTERYVTDLLAELGGLTIITIAHRLTTIEHYDLIYLLEKGRIISSGNYSELLENSDTFQKMVDVAKMQND